MTAEGVPVSGFMAAEKVSPLLSLTTQGKAISHHKPLGVSRNLWRRKKPDEMEMPGPVGVLSAFVGRGWRRPLRGMLKDYEHRLHAETYSLIGAAQWHSGLHYYLTARRFGTESTSAQALFSLCLHTPVSSHSSKTCSLSG